MLLTISLLGSECRSNKVAFNGIGNPCAVVKQRLVHIRPQNPISWIMVLYPLKLFVTAATGIFFSASLYFYPRTKLHAGEASLMVGCLKWGNRPITSGRVVIYYGMLISAKIYSPSHYMKT